MYGYESWTIKKAECWRIHAFELWCWRRLLRDPWTARRANQSILKEISPGCSLKGLIYFGHLMRRANSFEKTLMLGKIEGRRRRGRQSMRWLDASPTQWTWVWVDSRSWWWTGRPGMLQSMGSQRVRHDWATELNWTKKTSYFSCQGYFPILSSIQSLSRVWLSTVHEVAKSQTQLSAHTHTKIHVLVVAWREKFF